MALAAMVHIRIFFLNRSRYTLYSPQYVVPNVNHCMPEAMAKSVGVDDLKIPATPPNKSPDIPTRNHISHWYHLNGHMFDAIDSTGMT